MHTLPPLPFGFTALEPYISKKTLEFHYEKHHQTYITNLNNLIKETDFETLSLEDIILKSHEKLEHVSIFNNAAQVWNHTFYWNCLSSPNTSQISDRLKLKIEETFESLETFRQQFKQAAITQFGSGWAWLVLEGDALKIVKTSNADLPMVKGQKALLTCDVWEHAYYLDVQNKRADYVNFFVDYLINWDFVERNCFSK